MVLLYYFLFVLIEPLRGQACISSLKESEECLACSGAYFQRNATSKAFPKSDCLLKNQDSFFSRILIITPSLNCNEDCQSRFSGVYDNIQKCLKEQSILSLQYRLFEIEIFLTIGAHYIINFQEEFHSLAYFRGVNSSLRLRPLRCDFLNDTELCVPNQQKAIIKLKSNNIFIFIGGKLEISNIHFSALDQHSRNINYPCYEQGLSDCSPLNDLLYTSNDPMCSLADWKIIFENRNLRNWGLFNFEVLLVESASFPIKVLVENSEFFYFFLLNQKEGFIAIFTSLWSSRVQMTIFNSTFSDSFYLKGLIYFEKSFEEAKIEEIFAFLGAKMISQLELYSSKLRSSLNFNGVSFLNYNIPQIDDERKFAENSLLSIDASYIDLVFLDITFEKLIAQNLESQALISIFNTTMGSRICHVFRNVLYKNISNFILISAVNAGCIIMENISVITSVFQASNALIMNSLSVSIKNATFSELQVLYNGNLFNIAGSSGEFQQIFIYKCVNPRMILESSIIKIANSAVMQNTFSDYLFNIKRTAFTVEWSNLTGLWVPEALQDIVIYQQENCSVFSNVVFENISASTLKYFDKTNSSAFLNCTFRKIYDLNNFLAAESIYLLYLLQDSSIVSCAFLNFYLSLNGNRFSVQPKMQIRGLVWRNFTVRVGYFCAFSNVQLEIINTEISDMVGVKKDSFVRFFYIGRSSSLLMDNTRVIDCGYNFEPVLKEYAYNYQFLLGQFISSFFKVTNSAFITSKPLSLKTGFVASNRNSGKVYIINCSFSVSSNDQFSHNGVTFTTTNDIFFINNTLFNIRCPRERISIVHEWGAVLMFGEETMKYFKNTKTATVSGNTFENCTCRGGGGLTIFNYHTLTIEKNIFKYNSAWNQIGSLSVFSGTNVYMRENLIKSTYAPSFGAIKIQTVRNITIDTLSVEEALSKETAIIFITNVLNIKISNLYVSNVETFANGGVMFIEKGNLTIFNSSFSNIKTAYSGGLIFLDIYSNLTFTDSIAYKIEAFSGGVLAIFIANKILISNIVIFNTSSISNGGAFLFEQFSYAKIEIVTFENVIAGENGVIIFENTDESIEISLEQISCFKNRAKVGSCIYINVVSNVEISDIIAEECIGTLLKIFTDVKFFAYIKDFLGKNNRADVLMDFDCIHLSMEQIIFENNFVNFALIQLTKITNGHIRNTYFFGNYTPSLEKEVIAIEIDNSQLILEGIYFDYINSRAQSIVLNSQNSELLILTSHVMGSVSLHNIGAFRFIDTLVQALDIHFYFNQGVCIKGIGQGGIFINVLMTFNRALDLYQPAHFDISTLANNSYTLVLETIDSNLQNNGLSLKIEDFVTVFLNNCLFRSIFNQGYTDPNFQQEFRGIIAVNILSLNIINCLFEALSTEDKGSALYASDELKNIAFINSSLLITNSKFIFCSSFKGAGALFVSNKNLVLIINSSFIGNTANTIDELDIDVFEGVGAVGIILCYREQRDLCLISFVNDYFKDNYAFYHSPLFYVNSSTDIGGSIFMNNSDKINFTRTVTSYPPDIKMRFPLNKLNQRIFDLDPGNLLGDVSFLNLDFTNNLHVFGVKSGAPFNMTFYITDDQDKILKFDNFSHCNIEVSGPYKYQIKVERGVIKAEGGWFNFSNTRIFGWPNSTVQFDISFQIPKSIILNPDPIILKRSLFIYFQPCLIGEILLFDMRCYSCPSETFSVEDPMVPIKQAELQPNLYIPLMKCAACMANAFCPGGWAVFPADGFWRATNTSSNIITCLIPQACIGHDMNSPVSGNLLGLCKEGHIGNLCHDCKNNYGKLNNNYPCYKCEDVKKGAIFRLTAVISLILAYTLFGSFIYSRKKEKEEDYLIVYLRIGISFAQITSLLSYVKIEWPVIGLDQLLSISSNFISLSSEDLLFNDCIMQAVSLDIRKKPVLKTIISLFLPLFLFSLCALFWIIYILVIRHHKLDKATRKNFYIKIFASLIISVFLFHTLIIKTSFSLLNCFILDSSMSEEEFLYAYPNFRCWDAFHFQIIIFAVLPGIFIWGLGFPIALLFLLIKQYKFKASLKKNKKIKHAWEFKANKSIRGQSLEISPGITNQIPSQLGFQKGKVLDPIDNSSICSAPSSPEKGRGSTSSRGPPSNMSSPSNRGSPINRGKSGIQQFKKLVLKSHFFQFFYEGYKDQYSFWECLIFLKKFFLCMLVNFNRYIGDEMVSLLILSLLSFHLYLHLKKKPFKIKSLNQLEFLCLVGSIAIFVSNILLHANISLPLQYIFSIVIFSTHVICLSFAVYYMIELIKKTKLIQRLWNTIITSFKKGRKRPV